MEQCSFLPKGFASNATPLSYMGAMSNTASDLMPAAITVLSTGMSLPEPQGRSPKLKVVMHMNMTKCLTTLCLISLLRWPS